uniref:Glycoprotein endo-alpha-1,2-mannosidase n=1 Tax=Panagrellus redivivus TaxID=6233 RepID=A0A7E4W1T4_PANRE
MNLSQFFKLCIVAGVVGTLFTGVLFMMSSENEDEMRDHLKGVVHQFKVDPPQPPVQAPNEVSTKEETFDSPRDAELVAETEKQAEGAAVVTSKPPTVRPEVLRQLQEVKTGRDPSVHTFYYPWYDGPSYKGAGWHHWNHEYLPNWNTHDTNTYPTGRHVPPNDIASWYYPALGPYSSRDPAVVDQHFKWMSSAGIDVAVVSWLPERETDKDTTSWDSMIPMYLNATAAYKLKLAFHLEPYKTRTALTVRDDIIYIIEKYGKHPSFYKTTPKNKTAPTDKQYPLFYVYDSYQIKAEDWLQVFNKNGSKTIRDTPYDALVLGLYVEYNHRFDLQKAGFDGLYTYFASEGFSHGSTMANWPSLSAFCAKNGMLFSPSVGPGYIDTRVRAWNDKNTKDRNNGDYYREHFKMAHTAKADIVSITSFNEWHEGSQIEPAMPYNEGNTTYLVYDRNPEEYLEITAQMVREYFTPHHENIPMQIARVV